MTKASYYTYTHMLEYTEQLLLDRAAVDIAHDCLRLAAMGKAKKVRSRTSLESYRGYWRQQ